MYRQVYLGHAPGLGLGSKPRAQQDHSSQCYSPCVTARARPPRQIHPPGAVQEVRGMFAAALRTHRTAALATLPPFSSLFPLPPGLSCAFLRRTPQPSPEPAGLQLQPHTGHRISSRCSVTRAGRPNSRQRPEAPRGPRTWVCSAGGGGGRCVGVLDLTAPTAFCWERVEFPFQFPGGHTVIFSGEDTDFQGGAQ